MKKTTKGGNRLLGDRKPDYKGRIKHPEKMRITLTHPLYEELAKSKLALTELKLLDVYMGRIDPTKPEKTLVELLPGEIERVLNMDRIKKSDLKAKLRKLMSVSIDIADPSDHNKIRLRPLMSICDADRNEDGQWCVYMECSQEAKDYVFNLSSHHYFKHWLHAVANIKSRYSYFLYLYLVKNRVRGSWTDRLDQLKQEVFACENIKAYDEYFRFNAKILKPAFEEINTKTDLKFSYEPVKDGYSVIGVKFTVDRIDEGTATIEEVMDGQKSLFDEGIETALGNEFSDKEIKLIMATLDEVMPKASEDEKLAFVKTCYAKMTMNATSKNTSARCNYLCKVIRSENVTVAQLTENNMRESKNANAGMATHGYTQEDYAEILERHRQRLWDDHESMQKEEKE